MLNIFLKENARLLTLKMPNFSRIKTVEHARHLTFENTELFIQKNVHPKTLHPPWGGGGPLLVVNYPT